MNEKFRACLAECKQLNSAGLLRQTGATADKILYNHAIQMVNTSLLRMHEIILVQVGNVSIFLAVPVSSAG